MTADIVLTPKQEAQLRQFAPDHLRVIKSIQRQAGRKARAAAAEPVAAPAAEAPELVIDLDNFMDRLTAGDLEDIEEVTGSPVTSLAFLGNKSANVRGVAALIWVLRRKDDPDYTYEQARAIPGKVLLEVMAAMGAKRRKTKEGNDPLGPAGSPSA